MTIWAHTELTLIDANGVEYPLEHPDRHVMGVSGLGAPPIQHWATRAPFQHGGSHWGYAWQPRNVTIALLTHTECRTRWWEKRQANIDMLNPAIGTMKLRLTRPNWEIYELHDVWYAGGYELQHDDQSHPYDQAAAIQLVVYDPFWKHVTAELDAGETRDADGRICVQTSTFTLENELVLPFTGPWIMGTTTGAATLACTNDGDEVRPVITITGPVDDWVLTNPANGKAIEWDGYSIAAGEVVTLDIPNGTVTNAAGDNLITYTGGSYGTFVLQPGANALSFWASGGVVNGATTLRVCWFVEILGT